MDLAKQDSISKFHEAGTAHTRCSGFFRARPEPRHGQDNVQTLRTCHGTPSTGVQYLKGKHMLLRFLRFCLRMINRNVSSKRFARRLRVEPLEDRIVLSAASVVGTTLNYFADPGEVNDLTISESAGVITIEDTGATITAGAGVTSVTANEVHFLEAHDVGLRGHKVAMAEGDAVIGRRIPTHQNSVIA